MIFRRPYSALLGLLLLSCGTAPPPRVVGQMDAAHDSPATRQAQRLAPQAYAHAEQLRELAHRALRSDRASAQILSEHALAAYYRAFLLARIANAEHELSIAKHRQAEANAALSGLDEQQKRLSAEADDLELRVKVARDAQPLAVNSLSSPEREQARREAARALSSQARLLCAATSLLDPKRASLAEHLTKLDALDKSLARRSEAVPIDDAMHLRSSCLHELSEVRRRAAAADTGMSDALLAELSRMGDLFPFRDDRGVVITLRGLFVEGDKLSAAAEQRLVALGRVAKAHPGFPVLVVTHVAGGESTALEQRRAEQVAAALRKSGAPQVETRTAGSSLPVTDVRGAASERNQRIEIIFVSPA